MGERRSLVEGLAPPANDAMRESEFLQSAKSSSGIKAMTAANTAASGVSLSTRIHPAYATALKRASLERKLNGVEPNSLREILEEALVPWLRAHGYLP